MRCPYALYLCTFIAIVNSASAAQILKSQNFGSVQPNQVPFNIDFTNTKNARLQSISVYYDQYVHGLEFTYTDNTVNSVGYKLGTKSTVSLVNKEIRIFRVKSGAWIDAIQFCFSATDCTQHFGSIGGGEIVEFNLNNLINQNYKIVALSGAYIEKYTADWTVNTLNILSVSYQLIDSTPKYCTISLTNMKDNEIFNHKTVIFNGEIITNDWQNTIRNIHVNNANSVNYANKIDTQWPVNIFNQFKGLIKLEKGTNKITITYDETINQGAKCSLTINLVYEEDLTVEPVHLVMVVANDSKLVYDTEPGEVNNLESAKWKYRTMAWLWQAFTDDQIYKRNSNSGHRCFRLDETELINGEYYPKIHVLQTDMTTAQIQAKKSDLFGMCKKVVLNNPTKFIKPENLPLQFTCLFLDSHYIPNEDRVAGHDALGSGWNSDYNWGIFGSHLLYSHPQNLTEMKNKFNDIRPVNKKYTSDDGGNYRARVCNVGIGAFLHELGHSFGLHHNYGVMHRGFDNFNRAFYSVELSTNNVWTSLRTNVDDQYASWSKVDAEIMLPHHLFRLKNDPILDMVDKNIQLFTTSSNSFLLYANVGIRMLAFFSSDDAKYPHYLTYEPALKKVDVDMSTSTELMNYKINNKEIHLLVILKNGRMVEFGKIFSEVNNGLITADVFKTKRFGPVYENQVEFNVDFTVNNNTRLLTIGVYYDNYVHGLEFTYTDNTVRFFGYKIGNKGSFSLVNKELRVLRVQSGAWIDALQFCFSATDCTQQFGGTISGQWSGEFNLNIIGSSQFYKVSGLNGAFIEKYNPNWTVNTMSSITVLYKKV
ncbi:unnamed protein product [Rotaria sp. Silwood1]|nr:unnamed protein product [Rotaria sp. Silwood1]CAF1660780.1 unnamed protein product [Rotaria sp. Silwood1]CAF3836702.1 unnamed protein product [Rotaria sp. Silwood1]CAF4746867.1 unnamed protein product [Rotaria sp. Silwood1]CAF4996187.1 unnamed protein product [Rotaria sp. Silwood1]